jgi:hypothetical protein
MNASHSSLQVGTLVELSCSLGYRLSLHHGSTFLCNDADTWNDDRIRLEVIIREQKCDKVQCPPLPLIPHGTLNIDAFSFGSLAKYECDDGFKIFRQGL